MPDLVIRYIIEFPYEDKWLKLEVGDFDEESEAHHFMMRRTGKEPYRVVKVTTVTTEQVVFNSKDE